MDKFDYIVVGNREYAGLFSEMGFRTAFIEDEAGLEMQLRQNAPLDLVITHDRFYGPAGAIIKSLRMNTAVFCLPESPERDLTEEALKKTLIKAVGMEI